MIFTPAVNENESSYAGLKGNDEPANLVKVTLFDEAPTIFLSCSAEVRFPIRNMFFLRLLTGA